MIVWAGKGYVNENPISYNKNSEFLITPNTKVDLETKNSNLFLFSIHPMENGKSKQT